MKKIISVIVMVVFLLNSGPVNAQSSAACNAQKIAACKGFANDPTGMATCKMLVDDAVNISPMHEPFFHYLTFDVWGAVSRALQAAIKFFMGDHAKLIAELVFDGVGSEMPPGGNGGAYTNEKGDAKLVLSALVSPITDIPAETGAYPEDIQIQQTSVDELAKYRIQSVVREQAALDQLSADKWAIQYRAQQRAIQAMTDALVMKKAYQELAKVAELASSGSYANYGEAASTVATRRLLLDELMALRKRVIAARMRARAETMEMDIETVATAPDLEESPGAPSGGTTSGGTTPTNTGVGSGNDGTPSGYDNTGLGG